MTVSTESENRLPSDAIFWDILESVTDAVITIDEEHRVLVCNRAAEALFGYKCAEIIGQDATPLIPYPYQDVHRDYVERYIETGVPRVIGKSRECMAQHRDGRAFPVEISYSVSRTGGRLCFTAVIRDISQRKEMEREIRFMERLADIGKAVAHIGHEIRKPLMLIGGFASQVERCGALREDEKARHKLNIIKGEAQRLETLLNGLRLLTRPPTSGRKQSLELNEVLRETLLLLEPMLVDQKPVLETRLEEASLRVKGDPDQLKQVFLNLLQNALEAMERPGGRLCVTTGRLSSVARVVIQDNGPGIPPELQEKIFDPFFTTKAEGTGLGLAISRTIVQDHGGSLHFVSSSPEGTTFTVEFPVEDA
jgi:PAS domain S-box-containing protein